MYPCIRDDLLFVADTANAIITALETTDSADSGLLLRVSWSLGNLSDTLVVNKLNNPSFVTDFSDILLGRFGKAVFSLFGTWILCHIWHDYSSFCSAGSPWLETLTPLFLIASHHHRLLDVSLKTAASNDKVKSNIVRALGNLLRFMKQSTHSKAHFREYVARSVDCLLRACTSGNWCHDRCCPMTSFALFNMFSFSLY